MATRRYEPFHYAWAAKIGTAAVAVASDGEPQQTEQLQGWNANVLEFTPFDATDFGRGQTVRLALVDPTDDSRKRQFVGELDSVDAGSDPHRLTVRALGQMSRLRRVRTGGALDLTGMTDGDAVRAILSFCDVPYVHDDIADTGYELGQRKKVKWHNHVSGLDMLQSIDEVFGAASLEVGNGRVVRVFYDLAPTGTVRRVYRDGDNAQLFDLSRQRGGVDEIQNSWEVRGVQFKRPGKKDCLYTPYAKARQDLDRLGGGTVARSQFQSDLIQDKGLARQVCRRLMRWHNREPDTIRIETLNDPNVFPGVVVGARSGQLGIGLVETKRYVVMNVTRSGPFMTLDCLGGAAGDVGTIDAGYEKQCNATTTDAQTDPSLADPPADVIADSGADPAFDGSGSIPAVPIDGDSTTPWPDPSTLPAVGPVAPDVGETTPAPETCPEPCECADDVTVTGGEAADGSLGIRLSGTITLASTAAVGFTTADGDELALIIDPAAVDSAGSVGWFDVPDSASVQTPLGDAPIATGTEVTFDFCWDPATRAINGCISAGGGPDCASTLCEDADWTNQSSINWGTGPASMAGGTMTVSYPGAENDGGSLACDIADCEPTGDWTIVMEGQTSGPEQSVVLFLGEFYTQAGDVPPYATYYPYLQAVWGGSGATVQFQSFETSGDEAVWNQAVNDPGQRLQADTPFRLTIERSGDTYHYLGECPVGTTVFDLTGDATPAAGNDWDSAVTFTATDPTDVTHGRRLAAGAWWSEGVGGATHGDVSLTLISFTGSGGGGGGDPIDLSAQAIAPSDRDYAPATLLLSAGGGTFGTVTAALDCTCGCQDVCNGATSPADTTDTTPADDPGSDPVTPPDVCGTDIPADTTGDTSPPDLEGVG